MTEISEKLKTQDSPPAWAQEAYCPRRNNSKSLVGGGGGGLPQPTGRPHLNRQGRSLPQPMGGGGVGGGGGATSVGGGKGGPSSIMGWCIPCGQSYKQTQNITFPHTLCAGSKNVLRTANKKTGSFRLRQLRHGAHHFASFVALYHIWIMNKCKVTNRRLSCKNLCPTFMAAFLKYE